MLNLSYRISTCREGTSDCPVWTNCTGCSSYEAAGLSPNTSYTVTVDTFISLPNGDCFSQGCSSNTATARTGTSLMGIASRLLGLELGMYTAGITYLEWEINAYSTLSDSLTSSLYMQWPNALNVSLLMILPFKVCVLRVSQCSTMSKYVWYDLACHVKLVILQLQECI